MPVSNEESLSHLSLRLRTGDLAATDLIDACLDRIEAEDKHIEAWAYVARDEARREAGKLDHEFARQGPRGPLHGIPFGVKDIFDTSAMPTEWGSPLHKGRVPVEDAALVRQLRAAGAVVLGKTHTTAYAYFDPGPTRNPHNTAHTPGGSSSGSAAAVAAGMVPFAIGSQTMGSVLRPASFCGVVGFKPTFDRLPLGGVMKFAKSLDHAGFFTRTAADMGLLWSAIDCETGEETSGTPLRFINVPWPIEDGLEPEMESGFGALLERLLETVAQIEQRPLAESFRGLLRAARTINNYEGARENQERYAEHDTAIGAKLAALVMDGLACPTRSTGRRWLRSLQLVASLRNQQGTERSGWSLPHRDRPPKDWHPRETHGATRHSRRWVYPLCRCRSEAQRTACRWAARSWGRESVRTSSWPPPVVVKRI